MRAPAKKAWATGGDRQRFPPGSAATSPLKRRRTEKSSPASMAFPSAWESSARARRTRAQKLAHGSAACLVLIRRQTLDKEIDLLVRRLARRGLLEYRLGRSRNGEDLVVIEPQVPDYWPQAPQLRDTDTLVLSRFAYLRRRGNEMVLESPRAGALFKICDPKIAATLGHAVHTATDQTAAAAGRLSRVRASRFAGRLPNPFQGRRCRRRWPAAGRRRRRPRALGLSRSSVPCAQHRRPARQPAGRHLSVCRRHFSAAGGAAPLARKEDRSAQVLGRAFGGDLAGGEAAAGTSFDARLR